MKVLTNGDKVTYKGSMAGEHGPARVLGAHVNHGDGSTRFIIAILNEKGDPTSTLSNVRRASLVHQSDPK